MTFKYREVRMERITEAYSVRRAVKIYTAFSVLIKLHASSSEGVATSQVHSMFLETAQHRKILLRIETAAH